MNLVHYLQLAFVPVLNQFTRRLPKFTMMRIGFLKIGSQLLDIFIFRLTLFKPMQIQPRVGEVLIEFDCLLHELSSLRYFVFSPEILADCKKNIRWVVARTTFVVLHSVCAFSHSCSVRFHLYGKCPQLTRVWTLLQRSCKQMLGNFFVLAQKFKSDRVQPYLGIVWELGSCLLKQGSSSSQLL